MVMRRARSYFSRSRSGASRDRGQLFVFGLYFLCVVLLILSRINHGIILDSRGRLADLAAPLLGVASAPVTELRHGIDRALDYSAMFGELDRLKAENEVLKSWEWRAKQLDRKVGQLQALLHAVEDTGLNYVSGNVIADARGPFTRSVLINLGRDQGMRVGYAVLSGEGLAGRIVDAGGALSRVLLLNDLNSRIPVLVGPAGARALVSGDNSGELKLEFLADGASLYAGDEVYTSGSDGVLPRGLRVGTVVSASGALKVRPHAEFSSLDAVSVVFFDSPAVVSIDPPAATSSKPLSATPTALDTDVAPITPVSTATVNDAAEVGSQQ
jgi:rod shape-determining protein MreC